MNPEIMQTISLLEARLNASLEMARAKHQAQIEQEKSILNRLVSLLNKLIEKLRLS